VRCANCHHRVSVELVMCPHCGRDLRSAGPRWGLWLTTLVVVILAGLWGLGRLPIRQVWQEVNDTRARLASLVQIPELPTPVPTPAATRGLARVQMSPTATLALAAVTPRPTLAAIATPSAIASPTGTATLATPTATPTAAQFYVIQSGDSLAGIGARLGLDWQLIAKLNGISASTVLQVGQKLKLPTPTSRPPTPTPTRDTRPVTKTPTASLRATASPTAALPSTTPKTSPSVTLPGLVRPGRGTVSPTRPTSPTGMATATKAAATATRAPAGPTTTPRPRPTATPAPPTATTTPGFPSPVLVGPGEGASFSGENAEIVLTWQAMGGLPADAKYRVSIRWTENGVPQMYSLPLIGQSQTSVRMPMWLFQRADQPARRYTWFVIVVQVTTDGKGGERVIELSPPSESRSLSWN
jgi:LysM repeat protein